MSRTKLHALASTGLTTLFVSAFMMMAPPAQADQSDQASPDQSSEVAPASSGSAAGVFAFPQGGPGPQHRGPQHRGPRHRGPQHHGKDQHQPGMRSRHLRMGAMAKLSIEPTAGPVGTTITIYGDFSGVRNPNQIKVNFAGQRGMARPVYVASDRVAVIVPNGARTGPVVVNLRNRAAWRGRFAVTPRDSDIFLPTPVDSGLVGAVYRLAPNTQRLPDFDRLDTPYATIVVPSLQVSPRRFDAGFPGLDDTGEPLLEWFAIRFIGRLWVPAPGTYQFRVNSDDGSRLYIDDLIVPNEFANSLVCCFSTYLVKLWIIAIVIDFPILVFPCPILPISFLGMPRKVWIRSTHCSISCLR
jgi:hypothetical protein